MRQRGHWQEMLKMIEPLQKRICSLEDAVARLQFTNRRAYNIVYCKGMRKGINHRADNFDAVCGKYDSFKRGCVTSKEELKHLNHAYEGAG